ncbi:MAG TPA: hypothetical protein VMD02_03290 [Candidatus Omnitrophota bacterium]|nr:hypothetical protein [Candidatus Omnitrophota bacterium]
MKLSHQSTACLIFSGILLFSVFAFAVPATINYQGLLKDASGHLVNNPSLSIVFSIYGGASGGTALWTETQTVSVDAGMYSVQLGSVNAFSSNVFDGSTRYLGIKVGSDAEMAPRVALVTVPYSLMAETLNGYKPAATGSNIVPVTNGSGKLNALLLPSGSGSSIDADTVDGFHASAEAWPNMLLPVSSEGEFLVMGAKDSAGIIVGTNNGSDGIGVYGEGGTGLKGVGSVIGGSFDTGGLYGNAVWAISESSSGINYGGKFYNYSSDGTGVAAYNESSSGNALGGYFESSSIAGTGVKGEATNGFPGSKSFGGYFESQGTLGTGVYGLGEAAGGSFESTSGNGVYGAATSGNGVYGISTSGFSGFFKGGKGVCMNTDTLILDTAKTPASSSASGSKGQIAWDANYIYICVANNTWKRAAIATW